MIHTSPPAIRSPETSGPPTSGPRKQDKVALEKRLEAAQKAKPYLVEWEIVSSRPAGHRIDGHYEPVMPVFVEVTRGTPDLAKLTAGMILPVTVNVWVQHTERSQYTLSFSFTYNPKANA